MYCSLSHSQLWLSARMGVDTAWLDLGQDRRRWELVDDTVSVLMNGCDEVRQTLIELVVICEERAEQGRPWLLMHRGSPD